MTGMGVASLVMVGLGHAGLGCAVSPLSQVGTPAGLTQHVWLHSLRLSLACVSLVAAGLVLIRRYGFLAAVAGGRVPWRPPAVTRR
jgi:hypothetical protein